MSRFLHRETAGSPTPLSVGDEAEALKLMRSTFGFRDRLSTGQSRKRDGRALSGHHSPAARDTADADQGSYANGNVEFDRVIRDFRSVGTLELGYHRAIGQLATVVARIRKATGIELEPVASRQE